MSSRRGARAVVARAGIALALLGVALLVAPVAAKRIYKYQDENGVWHFSDTPPRTEREVESERMQVEPEPGLRIRRFGTREQPVFGVHNDYRGPIEVRFELLERRNVAAQPPLPRHFVVESYGLERLFELRRRSARRGMSYRLRVDHRPGSPNARHDPPGPYRLPFPADRQYPVSQGFGGQASHTSTANYHAVDIAMPEGTPVLAARPGRVMRVERDFFGSGLDLERYGNRANHIRVLHADGTMAVYAHLAFESIRVRPGERLDVGQRLGASGATGFASGPHLHFVVQRNAGMQLESVPFRFAGGGGRGIEPQRGIMLGDE